MPVIAIVGAGPQMGLALARTFGVQGYKVALVSRHLDKQETRLCPRAARGAGPQRHTGWTRRDWRMDRKAARSHA